MAKRTTRKKTTKKSTTRKKTTRKKTTAKAAPSYKIPASDKPRTKSEVFSIIADNTGLTRKQVSEVFEVTKQMIAKDIKKREFYEKPSERKRRDQRKAQSRAARERD